MAKNPHIARAAIARSKAQTSFEQKERSDTEFFRERRRQEAANREKTERLKALRLAKEAAELEAAAGAEATAKATKAKDKEVPSPSPDDRASE